MVVERWRQPRRADRAERKRHAHSAVVINGQMCVPRRLPDYEGRLDSRSSTPNAERCDTGTKKRHRRRFWHTSRGPEDSDVRDCSIARPKPGDRNVLVTGPPADVEQVLSRLLIPVLDQQITYGAVHIEPTQILDQGI